MSSVLILTRAIYYAYYVLGPPLTGADRLLGSFLMSFTTLVYYANYCKSFYVYTLSSQLFRTVFIKRVKSCCVRQADPQTLTGPSISKPTCTQLPLKPTAHQSTEPR